MFSQQLIEIGSDSDSEIENFGYQKLVDDHIRDLLNIYQTQNHLSEQVDRANDYQLSMELDSISADTHLMLQPIIRKLLTLINDEHALVKEEKISFTSALKKYVQLFPLDSTRVDWFIAFTNDFREMCAQPQQADKIAELRIWMYDNKLNSHKNYQKTEFINWQNNEIKFLSWLEIVPNHSDLRASEVDLLELLKQRIFDNTIFPFNPAVHLEKKAISEFFRLSTTEKKYRIPLKVLETILSIFYQLRDEDQDLVVQRLVKVGDHKVNDNLSAEELEIIITELGNLSQQNSENNTKIPAETLFSAKKFAEPTRIINTKQLYILLRTLSAAANPKKIKIRNSFNSPADMTEFATMLREREYHCGLAQDLLINMQSESKQRMFKTLWKRGARTLLFNFDAINHLFSLSDKSAFEYFVALVYSGGHFNEDRARIRVMPNKDDWGLLARYIKNYMQDGVKNNKEETLILPKGKIVVQPDDHRVTKLAQAFRWLSENGLDTRANKLTVYELVEHIKPLNYFYIDPCIWLNETDRASKKNFIQNVFNTIVDTLRQQLKAKAAQESKAKKALSSPVSKQGFFAAAEKPAKLLTLAKEGDDFDPRISLPGLKGIFNKR